MRIAVISDIHGNLVALDAVLQDLEQDTYDEIICLGDLALRGPQPRECLERIEELRCPVVMGNTDEWLLPGRSALESRVYTGPVVDIQMWCVDQIDRRHQAFVGRFQPKIDIVSNASMSVCFFHGSPRDNTENMFATTAQAELEAMIEGSEATVLIGGHTHVQMVRRISGRTIVNVGSVGLPFLWRKAPEESSPEDLRVGQCAEYGVVELRDGRFSVDLRRVPIDGSRLRDVTLRSGMPHSEWWLAQRVADIW